MTANPLQGRFTGTPLVHSDRLKVSGARAKLNLPADLAPPTCAFASHSNNRLRRKHRPPDVPVKPSLSAWAHLHRKMATDYDLLHE
jgi:hypothetical protein